MAWIRDPETPEQPISDDLLREEVRTGVLSPHTEIRHRRWTDNRYQPIHTIAALQEELSDPRARLSVRMRRASVPWGAVLLLGLSALFISIFGWTVHTDVLLDLGDGLLWGAHNTVDRGWLLVAAMAALLPVLTLAWMERAYGAAVVLTPALLLSGPMIAAAPELGLFGPALCLSAAATGVTLRHRHLLPWREHNRYGPWVGLPLIGIVLVALLSPGIGAVMLGIAAAAAGLAATLTPLPILSPRQRRRHRLGYAAFHLAVIAATAAGLRFAALHPASFVAWETTALAPAGVSLSIPTFRAPLWSTDLLRLGSPWQRDDVLSIAVRLDPAEGHADVPASAGVRTHRAGGFAATLRCTAAQPWAARLCESVLARSSFSQPYSYDQVYAVPSWRRKSLEALWDEHGQLMAAGLVDAGDEVMVQHIGTTLEPEHTVQEAEALAAVWRRRIDVLSNQRTFHLVDWLIAHPADDAHEHAAGSLEGTLVGQMLTADSCDAVWFRILWRAPSITSDAFSRVLGELGCAQEPPQRWPQHALGWSNQHPNTFFALIASPLEPPHTERAAALARYLLSEFDCASLLASLNRRTTPEVTHRVLQIGGCPH